jgi:hypothetical protein
MSNFSSFSNDFNNKIQQTSSDYNSFIIKPPDRNRTHGTITKHIVIDSRDRDYLKFPSSSKYRVEITEDLRDVTSIELSLAQIPNTYYNIAAQNNQFYISDENEKIYSVEIPEGQYTNELLIETLNGKFGNLFNEFDSKLNFSRDPRDLKLRIQSDESFNYNLNYSKNDSCSPCKINSIDTTIGFLNKVYISTTINLSNINVIFGNIILVDTLSINDYTLYKMDINDINIDFKKIFFEGDYFTLYKGIDTYKCRIYKINNANSITYESLDDKNSILLEGNIFKDIFTIYSPNIFQLNTKPYVILKLNDAKLLNSINASNNAYTIIPLRSTADSIVNQSTTPVHGVIKYFNPPLGKLFYLDLEFLNYDGTEFNFRGQENMLLFIISMLNQPGKYNNYVDTN